MCVYNIDNQHPRYLCSARLLTGQISDLARPAAWILHSIPPTSMDEPQNLHTGHGQYRRSGRQLHYCCIIFCINSCINLIQFALLVYVDPKFETANRQIRSGFCRGKSYV